MALDPRMILENARTPPIDVRSNTAGVDAVNALGQFMANQQQVEQNKQQAALANQQLQMKQQQLRQARGLAASEEARKQEIHNLQMQEQAMKENDARIARVLPFLKSDVIPALQDGSPEAIEGLKASAAARIQVLDSQGIDSSNTRGLLDALERGDIALVKSSVQVLSQRGEELGILNPTRKGVKVGANETLVDPKTGKIIYAAGPDKGKPIKLGEKDKLVDSAGNVLYKPEPADEGVSQLEAKDKRQFVNDIRSITKDAVNIGKRFESTVKLREKASPSDRFVALVNLYKTIDPGSVVSQGEQTAVQGIEGIARAFGQKAINEVTGGGIISLDVFDQIVATMENLANSEIDAANSQANAYINRFGNALDANTKQDLLQDLPRRVTYTPARVQPQNTSPGDPTTRSGSGRGAKQSSSPTLPQGLTIRKRTE